MDDAYLNSHKNFSDIEQSFRPSNKQTAVCTESTKLTGVLWSLYDKAALVEVNLHLKNCGECQVEMQKLMLREEMIKKLIPTPVLNYEQGQALLHELKEVTKNTFKERVGEYTDNILNSTEHESFFKTLKKAIWTPTVMGLCLISLGSWFVVSYL